MKVHSKERTEPTLYMVWYIAFKFSTFTLLIFKTINQITAGDSAGPNGGLSILEDFEDIERPFVCPRCRRRYKRKNNAVSHLRHECGIEPSFPCPICSHLLSQRRYIQKHIRRKHPQYLREYEEQLLKQRNNADANDEANDY